MRELKFRAWIDGQGMMAWEYIKTLHVATLCACKHPMQYTGLKDKNGVEIYEGDIVKDADREGKEEDIAYEIKYCQAAYDHVLAFHPIDKDGEHYEHFYGGWDSEYFEIIGNICENPELVKA